MTDPAAFLAAALYEVKVTAVTAAQGFEWALHEHNQANRPAHVIRVRTAHHKLAELHKRRQLAQHEWFGSVTPGAECTECERSWPCDTIRILAEAYGWTPEVVR